jgi:poly-gamma-glutamate synthesis protein (capsule biosynthesis protein)
MSGKKIVCGQLVTIGLLAFLVLGLHSAPQPVGVLSYPVIARPVAALPDPTASTTLRVSLPELPDEYFERLWFTGDVMLSRQVGQFAEERGIDYSWRGIQSLFGTRDAVLINFEACLSAQIKFDWDNPMRFPVEPTLLPAVAESGVTHASLANNHSLDCGTHDYALTKSELSKAGVLSFGHPRSVTEHSVATTTVGEYRVGMVAIHTLYTEPDFDSLMTVIADLSTTTDIQVAYLHWGVEYETFSHESQQAFAATLASLGIDLIVGHHPHVVQEVAQVGDAVVFYSLGNFIFDQYFSPAVQEGLIIVLEPEGGLRVRLVPVSSRSIRTQPAPLQGNDRDQFLEQLAARSDQTLRTAIANAVIPLTHDLATSTKPRIIAP